MAKVELKQPIVEAISEELKGAQSVVLVDYRGLTVAQDTELRKKLREAGVTYRVYKNTMMKIAFEARLQFLKKMQQHQQEFFASLQKEQTSLN